MNALLIIIAAGFAAALPQTADPGSQDPGLPTAQGVNRVWVSKSCSSDQKSIISEAYYEAQQVANALNAWEPTGANQDVMNLYMGTDSSSQGWPFWPFGTNYRKIIKNNIIRDASIYEPAGWTDNRLFIQCNKDTLYPPGTETCPADGTYAWTWNNPGRIWTDHYMTFCPKFFNSGTLATDVTSAQSGQLNPHILNLFETNRAATMFHESFHMIYTVSDPWVQDGPNQDTYGPEAVYEMARDVGASQSYITAESYTMAGLAIYLRQKLGLNYIPRPAKYPDAGVSVTGTIPDAPIRKTLSQPASGVFAADPNDSNSIPDSNSWDQIFGPPPSAPAVPLGFSSTSSAPSSPQTQPASPITSPTCEKNNAPGYPANKNLLASDGSTVLTQNQLQYAMRQVLCTDTCTLPAGISSAVSRATVVGDGCEIVVALPDASEAWMYRGTHAQGVEWQECWDSTDAIIKNCVDNGPNTGWWNGDHVYQFYQAGVRAINAAGSEAVKAGNPLDESVTLHFQPVVVLPGEGGCHPPECASPF